MPFNRIHIILTAVLMALVSVLCGCSDREFEPGQDPELCLRLRVSVLDKGSGTVSRSRAGEYEFELPSEDCEKLQTIRVIIVKEQNREIMYNYYEDLIQAASTRLEGLKFKVSFSTAYTVYLIGNEKGLVGVNTAELFGTTLSPGRFYPDDEPLENLKLTAAAVAQPLIDNSGEVTTLIPMTEKYSITTIDQPQGIQNVVVDMEENMFLTRGLSKFTFNFFRAPDYTEGTAQLIRKVRIKGLGTTEFALPNATTYDPPKGPPSTNPYGGRVITEFNVPEGNEMGTYEFGLTSPVNVNYLPLPGSISEMVSYSPDLYFTESKGIDGFSCSISFDGVNYLPDVKLPNLDELPRNSHVIVNITLGNNNALLLTVKVLPWLSEYNEIDFTHNIAMAEDGTLQFQTGTYQSLNKTTGRLVLRPFPETAVGSFGISQPVGATWYASLVTTAGELNAIQFQLTNEDGSTYTTSTISGVIDGTKTVFKVIPVMAAGTQQRTAKLQVVVTLPDGFSIPVNILKSTEYGANIENITFIQNPQ